MRLHDVLLAIGLIGALAAAPVGAEPRHGIAMHGEPALAPGFQHLPYANPAAIKGGTLKLATTGSFDSTNPFIVMGQAVTGVRTYTFESLLGRNWDEPFSLYGLLAESIDVSDDFSTIVFRLRPEARFSDGKPVTAADVVFSLELLRDHGAIDWDTPAQQIERMTRAYDPWPGAWTSLRSQPLKIIAARVHADWAGDAPPGALLDRKDGVWVATAAGALELLSIQPAGRRVLAAAEWRRGLHNIQGVRLGE